ncbi:hypothetical protein DV515_00015469, partial [Chloebia gouldiae]
MLLLPPRSLSSTFLSPGVAAALEGPEPSPWVTALAQPKALDWSFGGSLELSHILRAIRHISTCSIYSGTDHETEPRTASLYKWFPAGEVLQVSGGAEVNWNPMQILEEWRR